ncbi:MAG: DUF2064 domain-containing protein [Bacteroidota bacterium]
MLEQQKTTAILLFSRTSADEAAVKTFAFPQKNAAVAERLIQHTIATAEKTQLPLFKACNTPQNGNSFGERLANEIETVFQKGYESIIVIGNDCPKLSAKHLVQAKKQVQQEKVVLGPANDGGVYLIGFQKKTYDRANFLNLDWEKETLQATWKAQIEDIVWLETLSDIDSAVDLSVFLKTAPKWHTLRQLLVAILKEIELIIDANHKLLTRFHFNSSALRAPPFQV